MNKPVISHHRPEPGTVKSYTMGFGLSLILTVAAYLLASHNLAHGWALLLTLGALAISQLLVQLLFFLHLGHEAKPRWNLTAFLFATMVVVIVVFGSLWIMKNLSYGHHVPGPVNQSDRAILKDEGY
jgi:cytochrome o ubiquinol oxidase operon protein cyoD